METIIFAVHIDDIFSIAHPPEEHTHFKAELCSKWEILDLSPAKFALGIGIDHDLEKHMIDLSQTAFIDCLVKHFNMSGAHPVDTPIVQGLQICHLDNTVPITPEVVDQIDKTLYCELIGSLNYIAVAT